MFVSYATLIKPSLWPGIFVSYATLIKPSLWPGLVVNQLYRETTLIKPNQKLKACKTVSQTLKRGRQQQQQRQPTMSNPFCSHYTDCQVGREYSITFSQYALMQEHNVNYKSQALDHNNTSLNLSIRALPLEIFALPQKHDFSSFFILVPKHWVRDPSPRSFSQASLSAGNDVYRGLRRPQSRTSF